MKCYVAKTGIQINPMRTETEIIQEIKNLMTLSKKPETRPEDKACIWSAITVLHWALEDPADLQANK